MFLLLVIPLVFIYAVCSLVNWSSTTRRRGSPPEASPIQDCDGESEPELGPATVRTILYVGLTIRWSLESSSSVSFNQHLKSPVIPVLPPTGAVELPGPISLFGGLTLLPLSPCGRRWRRRARLTDTSGSFWERDWKGGLGSCRPGCQGFTIEAYATGYSMTRVVLACRWGPFTRSERPPPSAVNLIIAEREGCARKGPVALAVFCWYFVSAWALTVII